MPAATLRKYAGDAPATSAGVRGESFGALGRNFNCHPRRLAQPQRH